MENRNDIVILEMKKKIEKKRKEVSKIKKFSPVTNCTIVLGDKRVNLHTLNEEGLIELLVTLNSRRLSVANLGLTKNYKMSGYSIASWISDIQMKLSCFNKANEELKLKKMEDKLGVLLSDDKRVELELDSIADMIDKM